MSTRDAPRPVASALDAPATVLIVRAPYYRDVVDGLSAAAADTLTAAGATVETVDVAGAYELPQAIRLALAAETPFDGFIALGCIVRGETSHYDHICDATMSGLMQLALAHGLALGTGLLTVETIAQAEQRAGIGPDPDRLSNKGAEAAAACLGQIALARRFAPAPLPVGFGIRG